jgi:hypothetical protein
MKQRLAELSGTPIDDEAGDVAEMADGAAEEDDGAET